MKPTLLRLLCVVLSLLGLVALAQGAAAQSVSDFPVPGGWFYTQATVRSGYGYSVVDDDQAPLWTEYRRLGGPDFLGYPVSRRYYGADGFLYQAFERFILQWRPDQERAIFSSVYEQFTDAGLDDWLLAQGIPKPLPSTDASFADEARRRMGWLTETRFIGFYFLNPLAQQPWDFYEQAWDLYGLPQTGPERLRVTVGSPNLWPFIVQRFQKVALQLWLENGPGIPRGSVSTVTAGTLARRAGLLPLTAAVPEPPPSTSPWIIGQPQLSGQPVQQLGQPVRHFAIAGSGFRPGEIVTLSLVRQDATTSTSLASQPTLSSGDLQITVTLTALVRSDGSFSVEADAMPGTYSVTARGGTSAVVVYDTLVLS